jgi:hypothetical protein
MNERMTSEHDDARFDRLVDGDLNAEEYRALLASLDDEPGGWRRCALAFLEAQALRQEFNAWRAGTASPPVPSTANQRPASSFTFAGWKLYLAMAASFLIVFGLGVFSPRWIGRDNPTGQSALESVATNEGTGESGSTFANASGIQNSPIRWATCAWWSIRPGPEARRRKCQFTKSAATPPSGCALKSQLCRAN